MIEKLIDLYEMLKNKLRDVIFMSKYFSSFSILYFL